MNPTATVRAGRPWCGDDFPHRLPPMLVRELRQGIQSGTFFWTVTLVQGTISLIFAVFFLTGAGGSYEPATLAVFLLTVALAALVLIMPLRGLWAIGGERRDNGLDLLLITRLSAARIVTGTWAAIVAQMGIVAATFLPFFVVLHFFGGMDVLGLIESLGWITAIGAVAAAAAIALSTLPLWLRIGIGGAIGAGVLVAIRVGLVPSSVFGTLGSPLLKAALASLLAVHGMAFLAYAASRIAPPAEKPAWRRRLLALGLAAIWMLAGWIGAGQAASGTILATVPLLLLFLLLICHVAAAVIDMPRRVIRPRPAAATRPWRWSGDDFPCWLSPMLVRELRQGLQSGFFVWTFIGVQVAMFLLTTRETLVRGAQPNLVVTPADDGLFWLTMAGVVGVVLPLQGLTAVSGERVENNLDLIRLTRLSATQIISGKWLAIAAQSLLLATAIFPYIVVRHFFGGVSMLGELEACGWIVVMALVVAAIAMALSTLPLAGKICLGLPLAVFAFALPAAALIAVGLFSLDWESTLILARFGILAVLTAYAIVLLKYTASRIAPSRSAAPEPAS